jgi:hypothetical protein
MSTLILSFLLATAPAPKFTTLYDDVVKVGPGRIRTLDIPLPVRPVRVVCTYEVIQGGSGVRAVLLKQEDAERWLRGEAHTVETSTSYSKRGAFSYKPIDPDHYQLVLDNRLEGRSPADVHLLVRTVEFDESPGPIRLAGRAKGRALVFGSLGIFAAVAGLFAFRLRKGLERRKD